jgi:hypothetical protein
MVKKEAGQDRLCKRHAAGQDMLFGKICCRTTQLVWCVRNTAVQGRFYGKACLETRQACCKTRKAGWRWTGKCVRNVEHKKGRPLLFRREGFKKLWDRNHL